MKHSPFINPSGAVPPSRDRQILAPAGEVRSSIWALRNDALLSPLISTDWNGMVSTKAVCAPGALRLHPAFNDLNLSGWLINSELDGQPEGVHEPILITP